MPSSLAERVLDDIKNPNQNYNLRQVINPSLDDLSCDMYLNPSGDSQNDTDVRDSRTVGWQMLRTLTDIWIQCFGDIKLQQNVSILFADIVGFTRLSSGLSAAELVDMLNDLFGRFDHICYQTKCEKVATLGDCYYCVSGCPTGQVQWTRDQLTVPSGHFK